MSKADEERVRRTEPAEQAVGSAVAQDRKRLPGHPLGVERRREHAADAARESAAAARGGGRSERQGLAHDAN
eukprot:1547834-Rhodomonas_salina.1